MQQVEPDKILNTLTNLQKVSILLLAAKDFEPIKGKLWFQKELFLLSKNSPNLEKESNFEADFMGPYSESADVCLEQLMLSGIIEKEEKSSAIRLTPLGRVISKQIQKSISKEKMELFDDFKNFLNNLSQDELLGFIYFSYPEMKLESLKFEEILPRRKVIAFSLFKKHKISLEKASEIAGISVEKFIQFLQERKIAIFS
ncbi:MAG: UPF0175 family protein [Candidatus Methanoperedens sp.]